MHGQGTDTYIGNKEEHIGNKYVGEFKNCKWNGQGTKTFKYKGVKYTYVGEFKDNKYFGHGTLTSEKGTKYVGEWKDGKKSGQGKMVYADGTEYEGKWENDKPLIKVQTEKK